MRALKFKLYTIFYLSNLFSTLLKSHKQTMQLDRLSCSSFFLLLDIIFKNKNCCRTADDFVSKRRQNQLLSIAELILIKTNIYWLWKHQIKIIKNLIIFNIYYFMIN